jgi:hypothetical protein
MQKAGKSTQVIDFPHLPEWNHCGDTEARRGIRMVSREAAKDAKVPTHSQSFRMGAESEVGGSGLVKAGQTQSNPVKVKFEWAGIFECGMGKRPTPRHEGTKVGRDMSGHRRSNALPFEIGN